ncbi:hypothetical protein BKA59DRAFT_407799 [Fusarium tricinctum]|uniref:Uncharacterized protein n=1 Tax=Fusarium tricinctum TaxID=61284 RepID=A0A8K0RIK0_9HYPO|nr:hypothetical protein BKA59DRAFT_407799 [Fusarium tricinctum]
MTLTDLPKEVLSEIFSYFCLHCCREFNLHKGVGTPQQHNRRRPRQVRDERSWYSLNKLSLSSLALTCKALHPTAEAILYHEFAPAYGDSGRAKYYFFLYQIYPFMRTVGRRKDLAEKVRMIYIDQMIAYFESCKESVEAVKQGAADLGIDLGAAWQRRVAEAGYDPDHPMDTYHRAWLDALPSIFDPAYDWRCGTAQKLQLELIAMLVALLPRLEHISLASFWNFPHPPDDPLKALGVTELPYLRSFEVRTDGFLILDKAVNLKELSIYDNTPSDTHIPFSEKAHVETLRLTDVRHLPSNISHALRFAAKSLHSFVYEAQAEDDQPHFEASRGEFNAEVIAGMLQEYSQTLETLHLDFRGVVNQGPRCYFYSPNFTLQNFTKLRQVFLSTGILFDVSRSIDNTESRSGSPHAAISRLLPPSIEKLYLAWDCPSVSDVETGLVELAHAKQETGCLQHLRRVALHYSGRLGEAVDRALEAAGIDFVYERWSSLEEIAYDERDSEGESWSDGDDEEENEDDDDDDDDDDDNDDDDDDDDDDEEEEEEKEEDNDVKEDGEDNRKER